MGKGGLNRVLITPSDLKTPTLASLAAEDPRAIHIRTILSAPDTKSLTLRVAVENSFTHDAAPTTLLPDGTVHITLPNADRHAPPTLPPVLLLLAMQRPKATARILAAAASIGVQAVLFVHAAKVEKSYWDSKLFRAEQPRPANHHPVKTSETAPDTSNIASLTRQESEQAALAGNGPAQGSKSLAPIPVHMLATVRRRLQEGIEQAAYDTALPQVALYNHPLEKTLACEDPVFGPAAAHRTGWARMVGHPPHDPVAASGSVTQAVRNASTNGAVIAIGPEGGWTDEEVRLLEASGFQRVSLGQRVLRSETAVLIAMGLVHEGLRLRDENTFGASL